MKKKTGDDMQLWIVLHQIFTQIVTITLHPTFWIVIALLIVQNIMQLRHKQEFPTIQKQTVTTLSAFLFITLEQLLRTLLTGLLGGVIASSLFLLTGTSINTNTLLALWLVTMILFTIQNRFLCFAYAGGLLVLFQYMTEYIFFDGTQILLLITILHFTESILVRITGALQKTPIYFRDQQGCTIAGTRLQMLWPLPLAIPITDFNASNEILQNGFIMLPNWCPLFDAITSTSNPVLLYHLIPMLAMISYQDIAVQGYEKEQTQIAANLLFIYSLLLFTLVFVSAKNNCFLPIAALFSILGHEGILWIGNMYMRKYVHTKQG